MARASNRMSEVVMLVMACLAPWAFGSADAWAWILFQAVLGLDRPLPAFRRFGVATAVNACLLAVFSVIQWLTWNGKVYWVRDAPRPDLSWYSGGPFACHNHLAAYLNVGLGFA